MLVESLPFLKCLDISGTNLAGTGKNSLSVISMVILNLLLFFDRRCWKNTKWQFSHRHSRIAKPDFQSIGYVGTLRHIPRSLSSSSHPCPLCHWRRQWRANTSSWKGIKFNSIRSRGKRVATYHFSRNRLISIGQRWCKEFWTTCMALSDQKHAKIH